MEAGGESELNVNVTLSDETLLAKWVNLSPFMTEKYGRIYIIYIPRSIYVRE